MGVTVKLLIITFPISYIALFTHFIACGFWEAIYIFDGLMKNTFDIQPETLHADTQGQSSLLDICLF